ncbi:general transcriptional corepressor trfA-like [Nymphalis io]|uniref:general transcriptional corepressor trfA-like n=1 Tax=Inachis io TaxID=171585 RepID=UPI002168C621|nr:general transcriptional corepressor trfA-like [Nymphalis io]
MSSSRKISPAHSQDVNSSHTRTPRRSRSVCSAKSNTSLRLTALISDSFKLTPIANRQSVLNDDTDIEIPGRKSWWRKLGENSRDVMDVLENRDIPEFNNVEDEFDVEILSQEKKNYSIDLPESSDGESINSIVIPQRKLFTQKENQAQKKFRNIIDNRETLAKLQRSHIDEDKEIKIAKKNLFNQAPRLRTKPAFPAALLNISSKTVNKTKEMPTAEVKGQVRNLFGNRPGVKRKNMFADFIVSESEDEIPDIQPKVFGFQKSMGQNRRESSASHGIAHSLTTSIDLEMDDWNLLPSSTMVENQLEEAGTTPVKRAKLSKLSEAKESETTNTNSTANKQSNKSINSKNTSKSKLKEGNKNLNLTSEMNNEYKEENNQSINNSNNYRLTRNRSKSIRESSSNEKDHSKVTNKSKKSLKSIKSISDKRLVQEDHKSQHDIENKMETNLIDNEIQNLSTEHVLDADEEDFTLEYENDDEQVNSTNMNKLDNINEKETYNQLIEGDNCGKNTNALEHEIEKTVLSKTGDKKEKNEKSKTQNDRDEQDDVNNLIEEQVQPNKQQNQSLMNNSGKNENERRNYNTNQSQDIVKLKKHTLTDVQNNSRECETININGDNLQKAKSYSNKIVDIASSTEIEIKGEGQNKIKHICDMNKTNKINFDSNEQNEKEVESNQTLFDEQNNSDQSEPEESRGAEEEVYQSLNDEPNESNGSNHEESIAAEEEKEINESLNNEQNYSDEVEDEEVETNQTLNDEQSDNDEAEEADEEVETNQTLNDEQSDNDEAEEADEEVETNQTLNDEQSDNDEAEDEVGESDSEVNQNETEEIEEMEIHEEENESETDDQNVTENQEVSDEEDDDQQNKSNISQSENIQEEELMESEQEQSDVDDNEVAEDEIIPDESDDHDTRGRHTKKNETIVKSPEAILHDKISEMESFTAKGHNTSIRKTKSIIKNINIRPSLAPVRESTGLTEDTKDSSAEGSGWDSHRTTRKTIRLTMGKDFTLRKSLRALVMEKSAKRNTEFNDVLADNTKIPQANSTELPEFDSYQETEPMHVDETLEEPSDHEVSAQTRRTTLELYLQKIKQENMEKKRKMEEEVRASIKAPPRNTFYSFKMPLIPVKRIKVAHNKPKPKQTKSSLIPLNMLPPEVLEDMKYKPPKRFQPSNASWITKRLYKFIENKLEPKYDYKARVRAERFMELLYAFTREARQVRGPSEQAVDTLKKEMARLDIIKTHFEFYNFFNDFMPREIRIKVVPDLVNKISLPKNGIFSDIMQ